MHLAQVLERNAVDLLRAGVNLDIRQYEELLDRDQLTIEELGKTVRNGFVILRVESGGLDVETHEQSRQFDKNTHVVIIARPTDISESRSWAGVRTDVLVSFDGSRR